MFKVDVFSVLISTVFSVLKWIYPVCIENEYSTKQYKTHYLINIGGNYHNDIIRGYPSNIKEKFYAGFFIINIGYYWQSKRV